MEKPILPDAFVIKRKGKIVLKLHADKQFMKKPKDLTLTEEEHTDLNKWLLGASTYVKQKKDYDAHQQALAKLEKAAKAQRETVPGKKSNKKSGSSKKSSPAQS